MGLRAKCAIGAGDELTFSYWECDGMSQVSYPPSRAAYTCVLNHILERKDCTGTSFENTAGHKVLVSFAALHWMDGRTAARCHARGQDIRVVYSGGPAVTFDLYEDILQL